MSATKPKLSKIISNQLPEFIREDYTTFVAFLEAYYEFLEQQKLDVITVKDIDSTLDTFVKNIQNELSPVTIEQNFEDKRFILSRIKDAYLAKGSEASYKFLFKLLFNKNVTVNYPGSQMLRASDGKWIQDVSVFGKVNAGQPDDIVGRLVDVVTPNKIIRVLIDRRQDVEIEVDRYVQISPDTYEFYIDRRFFGNISVNDRLRYQGIFDATIVATTSRVTVLQAGKSFKPGQLFNIKNGKGTGSILKVKTVDSLGGITSAEFVKYGIGYETDFTSTIVASQASTITTGGTTLNINVESSGVTAINVTNGGSGYTSTPTVSLVGGGYTSAATILSVERTAGVITKINLATSGSGYVTNPTVVISGGGGTGASATSTLGKQYNYTITEGLNTIDEQGFVNYSDYSRDSGDLWLPNTAYTAGQLVYFSDNLYTVTVGGTSALVPPTHLSGTASIGTATFSFTRKYGPAFDGTYSGQTIRQFFTQSGQDTVDADKVCIIKVELGPLTKYPGYYRNNDGFLDDAMFIQDSRYYQAFSYVLKINEKLDSYKSAVKTFVHPSGMAMFGEYDIRNEFDVSASLEFLMKIFTLSAQDEVQTDDYWVKDITKPLNGHLDFDGNTEDTSVTVPDAVAKLITKGTFTESFTPTDTNGSINWTHVDPSGVTLTIPTISFGTQLSNWASYSDGVTSSESISTIQTTKPLVESVTPSESQTRSISMWAGWGETYSLEDYFLDDNGTYMVPTEFTVGGITYPSEVAVITEAASVTTNKYTTDTLSNQTETGIVWKNLYAELGYTEYNLADTNKDYTIGRTQTF